MTTTTTKPAAWIEHHKGGDNLSWEEPGGKQTPLYAHPPKASDTEAALRAIMRMAEAAKEPCCPDPESPAAVRNIKFANIAHVAAQGLGMVRGPDFALYAPAVQFSELTVPLRNAARYLLQNGQTREGLAVQACITMLEDDSDD